MSTWAPGSLSEVAAQIARYLAAHPSACDTAEGVYRWWLKGTAASQSEVSDALEQLVQLGRVERLPQPVGTRYRARHAG
jgi:hypothetical protein